MRRSRRVAAWIIGSLSLLGVLLLGLIIAGNTDPGRRLLERSVFRLTGGNVRLSGLGGAFPSHLHLDRLELVDDRGIWLTAEKITVDWTPLAYLGARLKIDDLQVARLAMERLPHSTSTSTTEPAIPRIDAQQINIGVLELGAPIAGVSVALTAHGSAHLRTVSDMAFDASIERVGGDGRYELHLQFDPKRMNASLQLQEPADGPLAHIVGLPGLGTLSASVNLSGLRSAERLDVVLQAGPLHGQASGTFSLTDLSADLGFDFESQAMTPRPDLHWDRVMLQGHWLGSVNSPTATGQLQIAGLALPGGTQLGTLDADLQAQAGAVTMVATARALRIPGAHPELLASDPIKLNASLRLDDAKHPFALQASQRLFALRGTAELSGEPHVTLDLRLPELQPFAALLSQDIRGSADVKLNFSGNAGAGQLVLDAKASLLQGKQNWAGAVGDSAVLHLAGAFKGQQASIDELKVSGRAIAASAAGTWTQDDARLRFNAELNDLNAWSPALAGSLQASGTLTGPMTAFGVDADAAASVTVRGSSMGVLTAQVRSRGLPSNPGGSLKAGGTLDGSPVHVDVALEHGDAGALRLLVREAAWKSAHADGDLALPKAAGLSRGQVNFAMTDLADLQDLLGMKLGGAVTAALSLHSDRQHTVAQLQFDARNVKAAQFEGDVHLTGEGASDAFAFKSAMVLPHWRGDPAAVTAAGVLNLERSEVAFDSLLGTYRGEPIRLLAPARISFGNGLFVDGLRLGAQQSELQMQGRIAPELDLRVSLQKLQPALINLVAPDLLAAGSIDAQAELHGSFQVPTGRLSVTAGGIQMADDAALGLPPVNLHADANLHGASAELEAKLDAGSASQLQAAGQIPLDQAGAINMKISGALDVGLINPLLEARGLHASGKLAIDAAVGGNYGAPQIGGSVELTQGSLRDYGRGVSLSDITAQVVGNAGALQIKSFTATAPPGKLSMTGSVGVLQAGLPIDIKVTASNAQPIVSKLVTANLDADLHIVGKVRERLDVSGKVHLNRTLIGIPNGLPPNVAVLDVRRRGKAAVAVASKALVIGLDVAVQAPSQILVQGRGLDAEMGGDLHVGGTVDEPQVSGGFDLERGSFSLSSNKLNFTAGRVGFNGVGVKTRIDPTLDFTAQSTVGDVTATLHITGMADAPEFEFTSSPALPQDEILARLLFGENAAQLSALQLAQIAAALASLSGVGGGGGLNPLAKIQRSLGLDRLTVGSGTTNTATGPENAGASIEAGRYISKRVYIAAKQSTQGASQIEADVDLTKHLKLQTKLGNGTASVQGTTPENDPGSSIGLSYQFEY